MVGQLGEGRRERARVALRLERGDFQRTVVRLSPRLRVMLKVTA